LVDTIALLKIRHKLDFTFNDPKTPVEILKIERKYFQKDKGKLTKRRKTPVKKRDTITPLLTEAPQPTLK
jgi:hypothetical protein